ncbi:hypothetical protein [Burkholderia reimsis]|uniref:hypothetical protein n=1 Tax=Burkholderia reimsis TaxID=2234132 RepID=UPI001058812A|nr:hypothetical protein [Burkholderia reimsis]
MRHVEDLPVAPSLFPLCLSALADRAFYAQRNLSVRVIASSRRASLYLYKSRKNEKDQFGFDWICLAKNGKRQFLRILFQAIAPHFQFV